MGEVTSREFNTTSIIMVLSVLATIAAVILLYIFVIPEKKRENLPKVAQILHDIFNFKNLFLETILKATYVISSVFCVIYGVLMLFGFSHYEWFDYSHTQWYGGYGILIAIIGPIILRIVYESLMLFIILVKNVIEINKKMKASDDEEK